MDKEQLIDVLSQPMQCQMVTNLTRILESNDIDIADVFEVSIHSKKEVAFRAGWMLEFLLINKPQIFVNHLSTLFIYLPLTKNQSVMRHYSKMVSLLTDKKVNPIYRSEVTKIDFDIVIELLFRWLVEDSTLVASKVHCMQALAHLSRHFDWITNELLQTIIYLEDKESIAFFARAKAVKKILIKGRSIK
ncbi:MAG: hypothetical protein H7223_04285 [Pedobacter sp.]|nr:hypothetical protein [Pedobacter sp.]